MLSQARYNWAVGRTWPLVWHVSCAVSGFRAVMEFMLSDWTCSYLFEYANKNIKYWRQWIENECAEVGIAFKTVTVAVTEEVRCLWLIMSPELFCSSHNTTALKHWWHQWASWQEGLKVLCSQKATENCGFVHLPASENVYHCRYGKLSILWVMLMNLGP